MIPANYDWWESFCLRNYFRRRFVIRLAIKYDSSVCEKEDSLIVNREGDK